MRHIGELGDERQAQTFSAFLTVKGIENQVEPQSDGSAEIWIKDEDHFNEALDELAAFNANPTDSVYSSSVERAKSIAREEEKRRKRIQKKIVKVSATNIKRRPPLTLTLIGLCVLVALITNFGDGKKTRRDHPVYRALQFVSIGPPASLDIARLDRDSLKRRLASIEKGQIWRTITPIFVHYGIFHLVFNMYWLFLFGSMIENRYGAWKLGLLILFSAAISNSVQCTVPVAVGGMSPFPVFDSGVLITALGGMSGVVYGLLGFVWMKMLFDPKSGFRLAQSTIVILLGWLFLCMIPDLVPDLDPESWIFRIVGGNVANWAHGFGLLAGAMVGYVTSMLGRQ